MSHLVNPIGFRAGKSFLWRHNSLKITNKQKLLNNKVNTAVGIESMLNQILQKKNYWVVKANISIDNNLGVYNVKALVYPLISPLKRHKIFPITNITRNLVSSISKISICKYKDEFLNKHNVAKFLYKLWDIKYKAFENRLIAVKKRKNLNKWLKRAIFRGNLFYKKSVKWKLQSKLHNNYFMFIKNYSTKKNIIKKWKRSKKRYYLNPYSLEKMVEKRLGIRVTIKVRNIFHYLAKKTHKIITKPTHQSHIWNKNYHYNKKFINSYYDIVNSLLILSHVQSTEVFVIQMIQQGLLKMHSQKLRPKRFFYFIDSVLKNLIAIRRNFLAIRIVITGKLQGGTSRTKTFSVGFGTMPYQSIDQNVKYDFGDVQSIYGSYGVKIFTWRKSNDELVSDKQTIKNFELNKNFIRN
jgi:hypothetical protein